MFHMPNLIELIILVVVGMMIFGGKGKISGVMTDFAQGIKGFKKGLQDDEPKPNEAPMVNDGRTIDVNAVAKEKTEN